LLDDLVATNALLRPGPLDTGMYLVYINRKLGARRSATRIPRWKKFSHRPTRDRYQEQ